MFFGVEETTLMVLSRVLFVIGICVSAASAADSKPVRIMPVGDSITEGGKNFVCYRVPLAEKLAKAGYHVEFVGSKTSESPLGPLAHEGYGGKNAEFLASILPKSFKEHPADIVLLHAGHNHFVEDKPVDKIVAANESMIATVRAVNPKVIVLLAQVIPSGKLPKYSYIPPLNEALAKLATRLNTAQQPVILVKQAEGFDPAKDTIEDKVHPNAQGGAKMAARWFEALEKVLPKPK